MAVARRRRSQTAGKRVAAILSRIVGIVGDVDTYVFIGIALLSAGAGLVLGWGAAMLTAGATLFGFGLWLGYWQLSARSDK